jgi:hypothetical protein
LLDKFTYLSTVSGGGYIGSWLSSWIRRKGMADVTAGLAGGKAAGEAREIRQLRSGSNYLSPTTGLSGDTLALVATFVRNLLINWTMLLPLLIAATVVPMINVAIVASLFGRRTAGIYHNTAAVLDADGSMLGIYRKMHIPDDPLYYEKYYFTPGDLGFRTWGTKYGRVGVLVGDGVEDALVLGVDAAQVVLALGVARRRRVEAGARDHRRAQRHQQLREALVLRRPPDLEVKLEVRRHRVADRRLDRIIALRLAPRGAKIGRVLLPEAHVQRAGAGQPHAVAAFAEIMGQRRDKAEPSPGLAHGQVHRAGQLPRHQGLYQE